ncbi:MAG: BrnT family toxin [Burkholderiaceae bacterium]
MSGLRCEWDEKKNSSNKRKHGVAFEEARTAFLDDDARVIPDPDHSTDEERFVLLGLSISLRVLVVCHCYRHNDEVIRIISARKADEDEIKQYQWWLP